MAGWKKLLTSGDVVNADLSGTAGIATANIADDAITEDKLANALLAEIDANTAKTGISGGQASAITANTAKVTNATHSGDVTGATALTIAAGAVDIAMLSASSVGDAKFLRGDNTWQSISSATVTSYTNSTNNRIITSVDSATINGESNFTFDGSALKLTGTMYIAEQADAAGDSAGLGQVWVNTATPNELYFTDDAGTDFRLTADTNTQLSDEQVQDLVGGMLGGTETFIQVTYQDGTADIDFVVPVRDEDDLSSDSASHLATQQSIKAYVDGQTHAAALTSEQVQDIVGAMFTGNTETRIAATYEDGDGTIDLVVTDMTANDNTVDMGSGFVMEDGDGTEVTITEDKEVKFVEGTGIDIDWTDTSTGSDGDPYDLTFTNSGVTSNVAGTGISVSGATGAVTVTNSGVTSIVAGSNISVSGATGAVTVTGTDTNTQLSSEQVQDIVGAMFTSNTETKITATYQDGDGTIDLVVDDMTANDDVDVSVANLKTRLAGGFGSNAVTIGDSDDVVTIGNDLVVTGDLTVSGDTTTLNIDTLSVEDKLVILSSGSGGGSTSNANASGLVVNTDEDYEPSLKWYETAVATGGPFHWAMTSRNDSSTIGLAGIQVEVTSGSPSGLDTVGGLFAYNSADGTMYFYNAV